MSQPSYLVFICLLITKCTCMLQLSHFEIIVCLFDHISSVNILHVHLVLQSNFIRFGVPGFLSSFFLSPFVKLERCERKQLWQLLLKDVLGQRRNGARGAPPRGGDPHLVALLRSLSVGTSRSWCRPCG